MHRAHVSHVQSTNCGRRFDSINVNLYEDSTVVLCTQVPLNVRWEERTKKARNDNKSEENATAHYITPRNPQLFKAKIVFHKPRSIVLCTAWTGRAATMVEVVFSCSHTQNLRNPNGSIRNSCWHAVFWQKLAALIYKRFSPKK